MAVNGKKKGNKEERKVAKWFNEWTGLDFQRVPQSGGLRWQKADNISGDIICADYDENREFPFSIEVKTYRNINFEHIIIDKKTNKILDFWNQAIDDANRAGKKPLLFMRYNGMSSMTYFVISDIMVYRKIARLSPTLINSIFKVYNEDFKFAIFHSDMLKKINYYHLKNNLKNVKNR